MAVNLGSVVDWPLLRVSVSLNDTFVAAGTVANFSYEWDSNALVRGYVPPMQLPAVQLYVSLPLPFPLSLRHLSLPPSAPFR